MYWYELRERSKERLAKAANDDGVYAKMYAEDVRDLLAECDALVKAGEIADKRWAERIQTLERRLSEIRGLTNA